MATVTDERDELEKLLRQVCKSGVVLPAAVAAWWESEQVQIAEEKARSDAKKAARVIEIEAKIAILQEELDRLT